MGDTRRDFLRGTAWMGAAAVAAGCMSGRDGMFAAPATMGDFAAPPLRKVRVGVVGLGSRGMPAPKRLAMIPGVEIAALCDLRPERLAQAQAWFKENGKAVPKGFTGDEDCWRRMCEWDGIDVVYNVLAWDLHACVGVYAMECGKHVMIEVPAAMTVDECWELVETAERTRRHCMQLENDCYSELPLLELNLVRQGLLGEIVNTECGYIHDLRSYFFRDDQNYKSWRLLWNSRHQGNPYPTHGLCPMAKCLDINCGDRFKTLVALGSGAFGVEAWRKENLPDGDWRRNIRMDMNDMCVTLITTERGRLITVKHDVVSPRPKTEIHFISGTRGAVAGFPIRIHLDASSPKYAIKEWPDAKVSEELRKKYMHPLWKDASAVAKKVGGHGGIDFLMDLRWAYCLQNGLPLDMTVYDLAATCSTCELSERSVRAGGAPQEVPDFTRGAWRTAKPHDVATVDLGKMGLSVDGVKGDVGYKGV